MGAWQAALSELSVDTLMVLRIMASAPDETLHYLFARAPQRSMKETLRISRFFGVSVRTDIYKEICDLFGKRPLR
jgi:hypothetical protein